MQAVLFGLFKDLTTAEQAYAQLLAQGIDAGSASLHRQDVPIAGGTEERKGAPPPKDDRGLLAGLVNSFFDSGNEMDATVRTTSTREALHRGSYAVSVSTHDQDEMTMAEKVFTAHGAVLQLHPGE
jgi:hypothetical protein